ncbi:MAG: sugar ABC transporter ATP-binding protein [Oscillospiraceae bacterium]|jgi:ABC-type sugar transport system ATPase subunit|nr:sugar ABC transporter ATP-binding protein [Oscillospiraceae bacterium]
MAGCIEFSGISKLFPGVRALADVSFRADSGQVLALLGENGAGKSTLLKILSGDVKPDGGRISIDGAEQSFQSPTDALRAGISVIYQERQLVPAGSVAENIFAGDLPGRSGVVDYKALYEQTAEIIGKFGLDIDPDEPVGRLPIARQQMVEIMKAYRRDSAIIAFDEPTASLTDSEISILFRLINELKESGKIIIYVSHRLSEIFQISDKITVLKDGCLVTTLETARTDEAELIRAMVGRDLGDTYAKLSRNDRLGDTLLEVRDLETEDVHGVSFTLRRGEVLGFAGLIGAGRTEVMRAIFGADRILSGAVVFDGREGGFKSPKEAIDAGVALCPEDRKEQGLVLFRSIRDNITMPVLQKLKRLLFLDKRAGHKLAQSAIARYDIRTPSADKAVVELSGGNQQKVILGRWTSDMMDTKLLILDEPTKGIDVGTKAEVYQIICDFAKQGIGVIFISSELTEVINVADRILVMKGGRITGELTRAEATEENVLALAMKDV